MVVATGYQLSKLPAFAACQAGQAACPIKGVPVPSAAEIEALVGAYNAAIGRVAAAAGATLVDLSGAGAIIASHPEYLASDGFHPSAAGAAVLAQAFYTAWRS